MKSHLYAATMSKVYSEALRYYKENQNFYSDQLEQWDQELSKVTHRSYAPVNLIQKASDETIFNEREHDGSIQYAMIGRIVDVLKDEFIVVEVRNAFEPGDTIELLPFNGKVIKYKVEKITNLMDIETQRTKPSTLVKLPYFKGLEYNNIIRKSEPCNS